MISFSSDMFTEVARLAPPDADTGIGAPMPGAEGRHIITGGRVSIIIIIIIIIVILMIKHNSDNNRDY